MLGFWWLWIPIGVALVVYALVSKTHLLAPGGPFPIGVILLIWGVGGATATVRRHRAS